MRQRIRDIWESKIFFEFRERFVRLLDSKFVTLVLVALVVVILGGWIVEGIRSSEPVGHSHGSELTELDEFSDKAVSTVVD